MKDLLVIFQDQRYRERALPVNMAATESKERLIINEAVGTWCFANKKLEFFGTFKFGEGPTNDQKESRYIYPKTQTVFDRMDNKQIERAFAFISSQAFGSGHRAGGAVDDDD